MIRPPALVVTIDRGRCQGHNRCHAVAHELFTMDEHGHGVVIGDGAVPPGLAGKARLAAMNCPERAVLVCEADRWDRA